MRYIIRNISSMLKNEPFLSAVIIICVFTSSWVMTFAYGLFYNFQTAKTAEELRTTDIITEMIEGKTLTKGDFVRYITSLSEDTASAVDVFFTETTIKDYYLSYDGKDESTGIYIDYTMPLRAAVKDGKLCSPVFVNEEWVSGGYLVKGRYFDDEEECLGKNVAVIGYQDPAYPDRYKFRKTLAKKISENEIEIFGQVYEIIGEHKSFGDLLIPLNNFPDDTALNCAEFYFSENITEKQYKELKNKAEEIIPGILKFPEMPTPDKETLLLYNNIILISVIIAVLTVIHLAALYVFIFNKRKRQLAVFNICGATKTRVFCVYIGECCLISFPLYILGTALYIPVMHGALSKVFPYIEEAYSAEIYFALFGIYALVLIVIMSVIILKILKKRAAEIWKEGKT